MTLKKLFYGSNDFSRKQEGMRMMLMYLVSGILTMVTNFFFFALFDKLVTAQADVTIIRWRFDLFLLLDQAIAWFTCTLVAFFSNRAWVFRSEGSVWKELFGFMAARMSTFLGIEIGLFAVLIMVLEHRMLIPQETHMFNVAWFNVTYLYLIKAINSIVLVIANFAMSKWLVFRKGAALRKQKALQGV